MIRRLVVFAHFDPHDILDNHVVYSLSHLKEIASDIVFVSTTNLNERDRAKVQPYCKEVLCRQNIGYDFMSWQIGLRLIGDLSTYDEVVICNDSVYGPLFCLKGMFNKMSQEKCDFWGITDNDQFEYHIQSYFLVFKKPIFESEIFKRFWDSIHPQPTKNDVIIEYEVGLYRLLTQNGFKPAMYFETDSWTRLRILRMRTYLLARRFFEKSVYFFSWQKKKTYALGLNSAHFLWKDLLRLQMPFIKVELLRDNPYGVRIDRSLGEVRRRSEYPVFLIEEHLARVRQSA